jgi:hypothetical protein
MVMRRRTVIKRHVFALNGKETVECPRHFSRARGEPATSFAETVERNGIYVLNDIMAGSTSCVLFLQQWLTTFVIGGRLKGL